MLSCAPAHPSSLLGFASLRPVSNGGGAFSCQGCWLSLTFGDRGSSRVMSRLLGAACTSLATICEQLRPHFEAAATAFRALLPHVGARSALLHQKIGRARLFQVHVGQVLARSGLGLAVCQIPSEKLNRLSECEQFEYERTYDLLDYGSGYSPFAGCEHINKDYSAELALR
jgi:hypothetical protein